MKHTPGPWTVGRWKDGQEVQIDAPGGEPDFGTISWQGLAGITGGHSDGTQVPRRARQTSGCGSRFAALIAKATGGES